jgi:GDP-L-fucose synthase
MHAAAPQHPRPLPLWWARPPTTSSSLSSSSPSSSRRPPPPTPSQAKQQLAAGEESNFTIWGSGTPLRQFIYSEDLGALIVWTMRHYDSCDPIILSVPESAEVTIKEAAMAVVDGMGYKGPVTFDTSKSDGQLKKTACNDKLMRLNPDFQFTPFREAVAKTCKWFEANYEAARK